MKRSIVLLASALLLTACAARSRDDGREEALRARYAAADWQATVETAVVRGEETCVYTVDVTRSGEETRVAVRAPEELAGIAAVLREDGDRALEFDGMILDAGSTDENISAVNAADIFRRAAAEGCVTERSTERFGDTRDALRLCFETEHAGETLYVTAYFDAADMPLYAEIERSGEILADLQFTDFSFGDILPKEAADMGKEP